MKGTKGYERKVVGQKKEAKKSVNRGRKESRWN